MVSKWFRYCYFPLSNAENWLRNHFDFVQCEHPSPPCCIAIRGGDFRFLTANRHAVSISLSYNSTAYDYGPRRHSFNEAFKLHCPLFRGFVICPEAEHHIADHFRKERGLNSLKVNNSISLRTGSLQYLETNLTLHLWLPNRSRAPPSPRQRYFFSSELCP